MTDDLRKVRGRRRPPITATVVGPDRASYADYAITVTPTMVADTVELIVKLSASATGIRVRNPRWTFDRPL